MPYIYQKHEKCQQFIGQTVEAAVETGGEKIIAEKNGKNTGFSQRTCYNRGQYRKGGCVPMGMVSRSKVHIVRDRALVSGGSLPSALSAAL